MKHTPPTGFREFRPYPKTGIPAKAKRERIRARRLGGQRRNDGRVIDEQFLDWVRSLPCVCGCGQVGGNDPNHLLTQKWGQSTRNDYTCVPMCSASHVLFHTKGVAGTNQEYGIDLWAINGALVEFYCLMWRIKLEPEVCVYLQKLAAAI